MTMGMKSRDRTSGVPVLVLVTVAVFVGVLVNVGVAVIVGVGVHVPPVHGVAVLVGVGFRKVRIPLPWLTRKLTPVSR
jgi:hypothetical protein